MMKVLIISIMMTQLGNWASMVIAASVLLFCLIFVGKHDMDWFEMVGGASWDSLSYSLILLSVWVTLLMILSSYKVYVNEKFSFLYNITIALLLFALVMAFSSSSLLMFYIFFEASLVPTFFLILGWGYQPERLQAGVYMMLYTIFASLPLLVVLVNMNIKDFSDSVLTMNTLSSSSLLIVVGSLLAFMVKLPLYLVHLWLPKAHVEAPVAGSMVLASVLLKLGGFGMIRLLPKVAFSLGSMSWSLISWGLVGGVYISVSCLRQVDVKVLIALSSVAHMAMVFGGILTMTSWGVNGALLVMLGHGFCSSGLFCIANMNYERSGTRSLLVMKGVQAVLPSLTLWWFLLAAANMAAPPSMNLLGEIHSILGLVRWSLFNIAPLGGLIFFAAAYSLYLYVATQHGKTPGIISSGLPVNTREHLTLMLHWAPINLLVVKFSMLQLFLCFNSLFKMLACEAGEEALLEHPKINTLTLSTLYSMLNYLSSGG
uniref:NADH-ubiquinone oxidoreductase chain 4 n=1 Tax=Proasellus coiffaiti TaxID=1281953 RepID=A0A485MEZ2_9CRUS|nr:NADH dehydrogenase subunit 4 [Proasellus coiffaiti]